MSSMSNKIELWVIYDKPTDYPGKYVARKWLNNNPTKTMYTAESLEEIREKIPGLYNLGRQDNDDPKIVEVWV